MVEQTADLDLVFYSLADPTRRDILRRVCTRDHSISELASSYTISFAATAKHVQVLEEAKLIHKQRSGKLQMVTAEPKVLRKASLQLEKFQQLWGDRFDALDTLLAKK